MTRLAHNRDIQSPATFPIMAMSVMKRPAAPVNLKAANDSEKGGESLLVRRRRRLNRRDTY